MSEAIVQLQDTHPELYDRIKTLYEEGQLNDFTYRQLLKNVAYFIGEEGMAEAAIDDMVSATKVGVSNPIAWGIYFLITNHLPYIIGKVEPEKRVGLVQRLFQKLMAKHEGGETVTAREFEDAITEETGEKVSQAYPQGHEAGFMLPQYDMTRWMRATRGIYAEMQKKGKTFAEAEAEVTGKWENRERQDYRDWLRHYREEVPKKYPKLAQKYYESNTPGYFIPNFENLKADIPKPLMDPTEEQLKARRHREKEVEDREKIETQRAKIISRLNAAEKLLASLDGQMFAGDAQEIMLKLLQDLKLKVQTANKITVRSSLFEDLIHKEANRLAISGQHQESDFIRKLALDPMPLDPMMDPMMGGGAAPPGAGAPQQQPVPEAVAKWNTQMAFLDMETRMRTGGPADDDLLAKLRKERGIPEEPPGGAAEAAPTPPAPTEEPFGGPDESAPPMEGGPPSEEAAPPEGPPSGEGQPEEEEPPSPADKKAVWVPDIVVEAQPAPPPEGAIGEAETDAPGRPAPPGAPASAPAVPAPVEAPAEEHTEDVIDAALRNLTVDDVIAKLETLTGMYKKREISRQLSILDIMMDRLGIGSYFPGLGEAMAKALESNQYISTRLEDALAKLKGSVENPEVTKMLETREAPPPQTKGIRQSLEAQKQKEEERKEKRREREMAKLEAPPGAPPAPPPGEMGEAARELAGPARVAPPRPPVGLR